MAERVMSEADDANVTFKFSQVELQRRAFGLRDEEYLRLKVLSSMLPKIDE